MYRKDEGRRDEQRPGDIDYRSIIIEPKTSACELDAQSIEAIDLTRVDARD